MRRKRVLVAMSGGVDSSVACYLLKEKGYEVIGITMQIWERPENRPNYRGCCGYQAIDDARRVAQKLGIVYYPLDFREVFRNQVINNFVQEYLKGRTPNPCLRCNQLVKFDFLLNRGIREFGADYLATGHYARIIFKDGRYRLLKGKDKRKDQSYFLFTMTQEQLRRTLFPLGDLTKTKVREIARKLKLSVAEKKDSQEICFIPDDNYPKFIKDFTEEVIRPGPILRKVDSGELRIMSQKHKGIFHYTIGQRKGIGIPAKERLYVIKIDVPNNTIIVGSKKDVYSRELIAEGLNWIGLQMPLQFPLSPFIKVKAKIRYQQETSSAKVYPREDGTADIKFTKPQWAITPGQAVVFYKKDEVLGGGIIKAMECNVS